MARKKVIRGSRVVNALRRMEKPFATVYDIADELGVSDQGVRNNLNELRKYDGLRYDEAGQAAIFWLEEYEQSPEVIKMPFSKEDIDIEVNNNQIVIQF